MNPEKYLLEATREDVASREAELQAVRSSLRYRVGGWVLEAMPLGRNTFLAFAKLVKVYFRRRADASASVSSCLAAINLDEQKLLSPVVVLGGGCPATVNAEGAWYTDDAEAVAKRLDLDRKVGTLVLRRPNVEVLRRLERSRQAGWHVIWCPEVEESVHLEPLIAYTKAHVDQCLEVDCV